MKNYCDLTHDLKILEIKRDSIVERQKALQEMVLPHASATDNIGSRPSGNGTDVKYTNWLSLDEKLTEDLKQCDKQISILRHNIYQIQQELSKMKDIQIQVFNCIYVDKMSVVNTSMRLNYSERRIYQILTKINKELKEKRK